MMVVCVPVTSAGQVDRRWGRAKRAAIATVLEGAVTNWQEYEVAWDVHHDTEGEGAFHARVARFLREHHVEAVVAHHMGEDMLHMLRRMGVQVRMGAEGDARDDARAAAR
jgi:predicted Fe-Mo cluster-binding NifX family protein